MAGVTSAVGVIAAAAALATGLAAVSAAAVAGQRLASAADAAALAAADAASGAVPGVPCERAAELAEAGGAALADCTLDGLIATVAVRGEVLHVPVTVRSRAGPPPAEH